MTCLRRRPPIAKPAYKKRAQTSSFDGALEKQDDRTNEKKCPELNLGHRFCIDLTENSPEGLLASLHSLEMEDAEALLVQSRPPSPILPPLPPAIPANSGYTAYWCEENIYLLAKTCLEDEIVNRDWDVYAVFISNEGRSVRHSFQLGMC